MTIKSVLLIIIANLCLQLTAIAQNSSTLITNVQIIDGTGSPLVKGAVRIKGDVIVQLGDLKANPNEKVIDGNGQILAPGFIDAHSHHLGDLQKNPNGLSTSNQGITTVVIGQDGESYPMDSLEKDMKEKRVVANVASYTGHSSLREEIMGEKNLFRNATQAEIDKMKMILSKELSKIQKWGSCSTISTNKKSYYRFSTK